MASKRALFQWTLVLLLLMMFGLQAFWRKQQYVVNVVELSENSTRSPASNTSLPVVVIVASSSPRSGSSFLGELLSSPKEALLFFEPFWYFSVSGRNIVKHLNKPSDHQLVERFLRNLINCRFMALPPIFDERLEMIIWRKPLVLAPLSIKQRQDVCHALDLRVVKVVRPGIAGVLPLLQEPDVNVHIINLVRDPRAVVNSVRVKAGWSDHLTADKVCTYFRLDLAAARNISDPRYTVLRYEDLVANPMKVARQLFKRMKLSLPTEVVQFIDKHSKQTYPAPVKKSGNTSSAATPSARSSSSADAASSSADGASPSVIGGRPAPRADRRATPAKAAASKKKATERPVRPETFTNFYSTIRDASFDGLHWLRELPDEIRAETERVCGDVMQELDYPLVYPQEERQVPRGQR